MSSGERIARHSAIVNINLLCGILNKSIARLEIGGSYRRGRADIGDVDMVVLPENAGIFLDHVDSLVERGFFQRGINGKGQESWGEKKRLIAYRGMAFDIAIANEFNFGYQHWLRTGPADANTALMSFLAKGKSKVRMEDGYLWYVTYRADYITSAAEKKLGYHKLARLNCPDETAFFTLLGMPFIEAEKRDEIIYRRYLGREIRNPAPEALKPYYLSAEQEATLAALSMKQKPLL